MARRPSRKRVPRKTSRAISRTGTATKPARKKGSGTRKASKVKKLSSSAISPVPTRDKKSSKGTDKAYTSSGPRVSAGRVKGVSLTIKFSFWIGLMIAFFMLAFAVVLYIQVERNLYREKKISGLLLCNTLSLTASTYISAVESGTLTQEQIDYVKSVYNKLMKTPGVKNMAVAKTTGDRREFYSGLGTDMSVKKFSDEITLEIDGVSYPNIDLVEEGEVSGEGFNKVFWFHKQDVHSAPGATPENISIYVILSKKSISESQDKLVIQIAGIGIVFVVLGFLVAFGLASVVVKPIKQLVHDMAVVSSGNLDHRTTAHSKDEVGLLANTFNLMTKSLCDAREIEKEKLLIDSELNVASDIQARLLPEKTPQITGYQIGPFYRSAKDVGGDYYDFIPLDADHLGIMVADVSGKGIIGSLVMSITRTVLRLVSQGNFSAADTLSKTNKVIARDIRRGMFVTAFYCILNARNREIVFSSAGHNPMVLYRSSKRKVELANPKGIALGFNEGPIFDKTVKEERLHLNSGDMIVLYTDGVVEAMDENNQEYTERRFYKYTLEHARESVDDYINGLVADIDAHAGNAVQSDDITVVALKVE
jgi:serine phosphatase RsbU (regulator of sigma subunit)